jgi:hypothetical protein
MSLKLLQPGTQPLGQFDGVDAETLLFKGGEVCSFAATVTNSQPGVTTAGLDQAAYDVFDGYVGTTTFRRPAVSRNWNAAAAGNYVYPQGTGGTAPLSRQFFLSDDGIIGYGTLFGSVVGGTVGQQVNGPTTFTGAVLGPSTATGSGKVTLWDKPGLYAVSLDAVDTTAGTGLVPTNTNLVVGAPLSFTAGAFSLGGGLLTPNLTGNGNVIGGTGGSGISVASLVEFNTNGSLVTTPNYLVAALNSPSGNVSSVQARAFTFATIYFQPYVAL